MRHDTTETCRPHIESHLGFEIATCAGCALVEWFQRGRPVAPEVALARLFGDYDLVGSLEAVNAPARHVLLYRPPSSGRTALRTLPRRTWLQVADDLWASHDGELLLLSTDEDPAHPTLAGA